MGCFLVKLNVFRLVAYYCGGCLFIGEAGGLSLGCIIITAVGCFLVKLKVFRLLHITTVDCSLVKLKAHSVAYYGGGLFLGEVYGISFGCILLRWVVSW